MNRGLVNGLFHALGTSRLQGGTVCDTCCETAWDMTVGPVGGADPESIVASDLIISWGADLVATNVHLWTKIEDVRKKGVEVIVIDPAAAAPPSAPIGTCPSASAPMLPWRWASCTSWCAMAGGRGLRCANTTGFDRVKAEILPASSRPASPRSRAAGCRRRATSGSLRQGQDLLHPHRRGHDAARRGGRRCARWRCCRA